jgi:hypothetical protein
MENSSSRPYFAIFAIVAILIAGFILKNEYSGTATEASGKNDSDPGMQLHESPAHWIQRVGWQNVGFTSQEQADQTLALYGVKRGQDFSEAQQQLIHTILGLKGYPHDVGLHMLTSIRNPDIAQKFVPDVEAQFEPDGQNSFDRVVLDTWYGREASKPVVVQLEKSKNQAFAKFVTDLAYNHDYPSGNSPGGA